MTLPQHKETEGEELIRLYLEEEYIKFDQEVEVPNLKGDFASSRTADFYLPQYKVYLEFFGQWNAGEKNRERYKAKKEIYQKNNIPCIYLYPENLGILNFVFKRRLREELTKHPKLKWQKIRLDWQTFQEEFGLWGITALFLILFVSEFWLKIGFSIILLIHIYTSVKKSFFKKG